MPSRMFWRSVLAVGVLGLWWEAFAFAFTPGGTVARPLRFMHGSWRVIASSSKNNDSSDLEGLRVELTAADKRLAQATNALFREEERLASLNDELVAQRRAVAAAKEALRDGQADRTRIARLEASAAKAKEAAKAKAARELAAEEVSTGWNMKDSYVPDGLTRSEYEKLKREDAAKAKERKNLGKFGSKVGGETDAPEGDILVQTNPSP